MMCRLQIAATRLAEIHQRMAEIGKRTHLSIRVWTPQPVDRKARLAICTTYQESTPRAALAYPEFGEHRRAAIDLRM